jgi:hypothetical protein
MAIPILSSIFGTKPQIADYTPLDFSQEQIDALLGDLAAFPKISALGADFQQSYLSELNAAIPGFSDILAMGGDTTKEMLTQASSELQGQIPSDVAAQVQRTSAFQNLLSGAGGSMASANTARNYGLTSLDLINQGANLAGQAGNAAQRWASLSGAGAATNVMAGMTVTPQQRAQFDMQQNLIKQAVQQAKFNVAAAPDPIAKGLSDIVENLTAAYLGGKVGQIGAGNQQATAATGLNPALETAGPGNAIDAGGLGSLFDTAFPGDTGSGNINIDQSTGAAGGLTPSSINDSFTLPTDILTSDTATQPGATGAGGVGGFSYLGPGAGSAGISLLQQLLNPSVFNPGS